jgi:hypothetical protein
MRVPLLPPLESRDSVGDKDSLGVNLFLEQEDAEKARAVKRAGIVVEVSGAGIPGAGVFSYDGEVYIWDTSTPPLTPNIVAPSAMTTLIVVSDVPIGDGQHRSVTVSPNLTGWSTGGYFLGGSIPLAAGSVLLHGSAATSPPITIVGGKVFTYQIGALPLIASGSAGAGYWRTDFTFKSLAGYTIQGISGSIKCGRGGGSSITPIYYDASDTQHTLNQTVSSISATAFSTDGTLIVGIDSTSITTMAVLWNLLGVETFLDSGVYNKAEAYKIKNNIIVGSVFIHFSGGFNSFAPCYWDASRVLHTLSSDRIGMVFDFDGTTMVGVSANTTDYIGHASTWVGGVWGDLGIPSGYDDSTATGIGGSLICGYAFSSDTAEYDAVYWSGGSPHILPTLVGVGDTKAYDTNGSIIVGESKNKAVYWDNAFAIHELPGGAYIAFSINK